MERAPSVRNQTNARECRPHLRVCHPKTHVATQRHIESETDGWTRNPPNEGLRKLIHGPNQSMKVLPQAALSRVWPAAALTQELRSRLQVQPRAEGPPFSGQNDGSHIRSLSKLLEYPR
jgi:hypothetical protein